MIFDLGLEKSCARALQWLRRLLMDNVVGCRLGYGTGRVWGNAHCKEHAIRIKRYEKPKHSSIAPCYIASAITNTIVCFVHIFS